MRAVGAGPRPVHYKPRSPGPSSAPSAPGCAAGARSRADLVCRTGSHVPRSSGGGRGAPPPQAAGQQDQQCAVGGGTAWPPHAALQDDQLLPEQGILQEEFGLGPGKIGQRATDDRRSGRTGSGKEPFPEHLRCSVGSSTKVRYEASEHEWRSFRVVRMLTLQASHALPHRAKAPLVYQRRFAGGTQGCTHRCT